MQFGRILGPLQAVAGAFLKLGKSIYLHPRLAHPLQGARAGTFWDSWAQTLAISRN